MTMDASLQDQLRRYLIDNFAAEDETLAYVRRRTAELGLPQISLSPDEGKLLQLLVMLSGARKAIEIGALAGYSAIWIARGLPSGGKLITIEKSGTHARVTREHIEGAGLGDKVTVLQGDGRQMLSKLENEAPWDMLFIDADKPSYPHYLEWAGRHLRVGGAVMAHNAFWQGRILAPETEDDQALVAFNRALADDPRWASSIIAVGDGLALGIKQF